MSEQIVLFPSRLDRTTAPERLPVDAARILENVEVDFALGRLRRRGGMAKTDVAASSSSIASCFYALRHDGAGLLFDSSEGGVVRVSIDPVAGWNDVDDYGAIASVGNLENFNEDGAETGFVL